MAPNSTIDSSGMLNSREFLKENMEIQKQDIKSEIDLKNKTYKWDIVWRNVIIFAYLHLGSLYGIYLIFTSAKIATTIFAYLLYQVSGFGITAGAHRLWAHRAYKANRKLTFLLMIFNTMAFEDAVVDWARDHRLHHKHSETDADPHNATRGFFFSHVGWLLVKKHPDIKEKGKSIDVSDLYNDPILRFQKKYYMYLMPLICFILPTVIPVYFWNETWTNAYFVPTVLRYVFTLNMTWLVNSAAHLYGNRPYDKYINPSENKLVSIGALGEGWHNYHHVFPYDYKAAELGNYQFNFTTAFIEFFAKIGWAYDLKTMSPELIERRVKRTGDGTHDLWGWGDKDQTAEDKKDVLILKQKN